jgi:ribonuclease P protein component
LRASASGELPREARLRRRSEFSRIQRRGARVHTGAFTIIVETSDGARPRIGCAISRKVGNAVVRNRVRRLLKEIFRRCAGELPAIDLVFVAKPEAAVIAERGFHAMADELLPAIGRAVDAVEKRRRSKKPQAGEGVGR